MLDILVKFVKSFENDSNFCFADYENNNLIAYVKKMDYDYIKSFPDTFEGKNVKLHYAVSKKVDKNLYVINIDLEIDHIKGSIESLLHTYGARILSKAIYEKTVSEREMLDKYPHLDIQLDSMIKRYPIERIQKEFEYLRTPDVTMA